MRLKPSGSEWRRLSFIGEGRRPQSGLSPPPPPRIMRARSGEVAEWSNAPDSKSGLRLCRNVGSNPTLSAIDLSDQGQRLDRSRESRLVARFCVLGSELLRAHKPTIARFREEVSGLEFPQFGPRR